MLISWKFCFISSYEHLRSISILFCANLDSISALNISSFLWRSLMLPICPFTKLLLCYTLSCVDFMWSYNFDINYVIVLSWPIRFSSTLFWKASLNSLCLALSSLIPLIMSSSFPMTSNFYRSISLTLLSWSLLEL